MSHLSQQRTHAVRRLKERYDIDITWECYDRLCDAIRHRDPKFMMLKEDAEGETWMVTMDNKPIRAVFDKLTRQIVTFIPLKTKFRKGGNVESEENKKIVKQMVRDNQYKKVRLSKKKNKRRCLGKKKNISREVWYVD